MDKDTATAFLEVKRAQNDVLATLGAIVGLLVTKGVLTQYELDCAKAIMLSDLDQMTQQDTSLFRQYRDSLPEQD